METKYYNVLQNASITNCLWQKQKSPVSAHRSASKLLRWRAFSPFLANREIRDTYAGTIYKVWWLTHRPHRSGKRSHPYVKKSFKTRHGRIPIDPAIVAAIGHHFIAEKKNTKCRRAGLRWPQGKQKPETYFGEPKCNISLGIFLLASRYFPYVCSLKCD